MPGHVLQRFIVHEHRMRWPVPADLADKISGRQVLGCDRRGKYLLIHFDHGTQIVHLGMSGSMRRVPLEEGLRKHDHAEWVFEHARFLLHDPRRFGAILWHDRADGPIEAHPLLAGLGMEPFDPGFTPAYLHSSLKGKAMAIKQALLGGRIVVGVGNIYASEALFRARINPRTAGGKLSAARCDALVAAIQATLRDALESGGSTLRDYVNATGQPGAYFTLHAAVYEKAGRPCGICATPIRRIVQGQRASYYCPKCQRR